MSGHDFGGGNQSKRCKEAMIRKRAQSERAPLKNRGGKNYIDNYVLLPRKYIISRESSYFPIGSQLPDEVIQPGNIPVADPDQLRQGLINLLSYPFSNLIYFYWSLFFKVGSISFQDQAILILSQ